MKKLAKILKHNRALFSIYRGLFGFLFRFLGFFVRTDEKLILFVSYGGESFGDSPRVLFESMENDVFFKDYIFVWALKENLDIPRTKTIRMDSLRYFITALKAKVWITNVNVERGLRFKKKNTIYLNTWHGTGPKKSGRAIKNRTDYDFSNVDILCVDGNYTKENFIKFFNAKSENMVWCGRPREDGLFNYNSNQELQIKQKLNVPVDKKIIFYAPTWREKSVRLLNLERLLDLLGPDYVLIVRGHHFSDNRFSASEKRIIDATEYCEINDLYLLSDYLISDYSSAFFDFGLLGKPFYCFATDYDFYLKTTGLFIDIKNTFVGGVFDDEAKLAKHILNSNYANESEICYKICRKYVEIHGNATKTCIDKLKEKLEANDQ